MRIKLWMMTPGEVSYDVPYRHQLDTHWRSRLNCEQNLRCLESKRHGKLSDNPSRILKKSKMLRGQRQRRKIKNRESQGDRVVVHEGIAMKELCMYAHTMKRQ
jgi:hypothetical protein